MLIHHGKPSPSVPARNVPSDLLATIRTFGVRTAVYLTWKQESYSGFYMIEASIRKEMLTLETYAERMRPSNEECQREIAAKLADWIAQPCYDLPRVHPLRAFWWKWSDRISTAWSVLRGRHDCGGW